jgi:hypothetical protein
MHRRLGPALPGDLGRPILNAGAAPNTAVPATTPDPEAQRRAQEIEAARLSRLFAQTDQSIGQLLPSASAGTATPPTATPPVDAGSAQNMQDRKTAFLNASTDKRAISPDGSKPRRRLMSYRQARSFRLRSSRASVPICPARSPPR